MRVAQVAAEIAPWCASGGLGQVMGALPEAIATTGRATVDAFFPLCRGPAAALDLHEVGRLSGGGRLVRVDGGAAAIYFIDAPHYFDRPSLYGDHGNPYPDDAERFAYFNRAVIEAWTMTGRPDIVHSHDWHAAIISEFLGSTPDRPATALTIHNLAYQGVFAANNEIDLAPIGGAINFLASGIANADVVTTVSPTYAVEIVTEGAGLETVLAGRAPLVGILNGIDQQEWDPASDPMIPANYDAETINVKATSRRALVESMSIDVTDGDLVVGVVSRLVSQKGIDLVIDAAAATLDGGVRLAVLGDGDPEIEAELAELAAAHQGRVAVRIGWDRALAHLIVAGSDVLAVPSRYEPCGLTQMQAMRYGTVPVVHAVGGLRDTVIDPGDDALGTGVGSGFTFDEPTGRALARALERAARFHRTPGWVNLQRSIMARDWSWQPAAQAYANLYEEMVAR